MSDASVGFPAVCFDRFCSPQAAQPVELATTPLPQLISRLQKNCCPRVSEYCAELERRFVPLLWRVWRKHGVKSYPYRDFVQDVWVRIFANLPTLRDVRFFPGLFKVAAYSAAVDILRKTMRNEQLAVDLAAVAIDRVLRDNTDTCAYLDRLSPRDQTLIVYIVIQGCTAPEVASKTGLSEEAVQSGIRRAKNRLREIISRETSAL